MTAWILAHLSRWLETVRIGSLSNLLVASILKFSAPSIENFTLHWVDRVTLKSYASTKRSSHQQRRRYICPPSTNACTNREQDQHGNWKMQGPKAVLVTKSSATHCRSWENGPEHICAIARTHSNIVKFGALDHEYDKACESLRGLATRALAAHNHMSKTSPNDHLQLETVDAGKVTSPRRQY